MIYDELCSDLTRHLFDINNGDMYTDANLWQSHNQGYEENCTFNYGFVNVGSSDDVNKRWLPLKGDIIEYWHIPSANINCVELRANDNSYGIRQRLMDYAEKSYFDERELSYAEGYYLITWKDRARRGDNGAEVNDSYEVRVTSGDPHENNGRSTSTVLFSKTVSDGIMTSEWCNRCLLVRLTRAQEFNGENIWISFKNTHEGTFGTLITDVEVHPLTLESDDYVIAPSQGTTTPESIAWIKAHTSDENIAPSMPTLLFTSTYTDAFSIKAKLVVTYNRMPVTNAPSSVTTINSENIARDTVTIPSTGWKTLNGDWDISSDNEWLNEISYGFFGGDATLLFEIYDSENTKIGGTHEYNFRIAGQNPDDTICHNYIISELASRGLSDMSWCMPAVAKRESFGYGGKVDSYRPFVWVEDHNVVFNQFRAGGGHHTRILGKEGIPLWARDDDGGEDGAGGYGMFQVTGNVRYGKYYAIPRGQIWNWQDNVKAGLDILKAKYDEASSTFNDQFDDQESAVGIRSLPTYRVKHESPNPGASYDFTFTQDGDRKMLHLCVLKQYNGASKYNVTKTQAETRDANKGVVREGNFVLCPAGSGYYCSWLDSYNKNGYNFTNQWVVGPYASNGEDYVDLVLSMVNLNNNEN